MGGGRNPAARKKIEQDCADTQAVANGNAFRGALGRAGGGGKPHGERRGTRAGPSAKADPEKRNSDHDPLIDQVIEAMRRMSKEDAARLVTISKALVGEGSVERAEAMPDLKPLPVPDLAAHPAPAFPPRRMSPAGTKGRGKTAVR